MMYKAQADFVTLLGSLYLLIEGGAQDHWTHGLGEGCAILHSGERTHEN